MPQRSKARARRRAAARIAVASFLVAVVAAGVAFWRALPEPLFATPTSSLLFDREGRLLSAAIAADEQWRFPPAPALPEKYRVAVIHFEDRRFPHHPGVDLIAALRALYQNLSQGHIVSGGSTISMQVIRLSRASRSRAGSSAGSRSYGRKLLEMILALRLELRYSKREILALYAAHTPFGGNTVGLEAAAWRYFGRAPAELSWAETCFLAVLPNRPALIRTEGGRRRLVSKRDRLLHKLRRAGVIDPLTAELARGEPLPRGLRPLPRLAPHLHQTLIARGRGHGRRLTSSLAAPLQERALAITARHARTAASRRIYNAAALVIDNIHFRVLAYVGNRTTEYRAERGYAIDLIPRPRSTGSVLKPFLFAAMLEEGEILPTTLVPDVPTHFGSYAPENFDRSYRGAVPARVALAQSLNVPAARMLRSYGVGRFHHLLEELGMTTLHRDAEDYGLTLILGGAEGSLWELASLYANLARRAAGREPREEPALLATAPPSPRSRRRFGPASAWLTLEALCDATRPEGEDGWKRFARARKIAWKTGTSYGLRDAWAVGVTPRYTVAVWLGNADGEGRVGLSGLSTAAPLLFDIFSRLDPGPWFREPREDMKPVQICRDDGYLADGRCETATAWIPRHNHFAKPSPHHRLVHLDETGTRRVDSRCEAVHRMRHRTWFVLPPSQEFYYRRHSALYRPLPPVREDCAVEAARSGGPIALLYPERGTTLYIPRDLRAQRSRAIFQAVHRDPDAVLFWHLDEDYLGATETFHQFPVLAEPGPHRITLVDQRGNRLERTFVILGREGEGATRPVRSGRHRLAAHAPQLASPDRSARPTRQDPPPP